MKCNVFVGIIFGLNIGLLCSLLLCFPNNFTCEVPVEIIDTIPDTTIDTTRYEYIDTTVVVYPWGREEIYYFKYK